MGPYVQYVFLGSVLCNAHVDVSRVNSSALKSADGSAENQMIVESDDFNKQLHPSFLCNFGLTSVSQISFFVLNSLNSISTTILWSLNPGGPILLCCHLYSISRYYPPRLNLAVAHEAIRGRIAFFNSFINLLLFLALPSVLLLLHC